GVTSVHFDLAYDPEQVRITGATVAAGLPAGASVSIDTTTNVGTATIDFSSLALPSGTATFINLQANIPIGATYKAVKLLDIQNLLVNGGSLPGLDRDALQVVDYFGDVTGNRSYSGVDASRVARVGVGLDRGFHDFPNVDPFFLADVNENGVVSGIDASKIARAGVGLPVPEIPLIPGAG